MVLTASLVSTAAGVAVPPGYTRSCSSGEDQGTIPNLSAQGPLPKSVTGRVDFLAARYRSDGVLLRTISLGHPDHLHPMASSFKPLVVHAVLKDIDAGRLKLNTPVQVSDATRSLGPFPSGITPVSTLLDIAINGSNNTAADLLLLQYGPDRLAREVDEQSGHCTQVLLTTKGWWTAQSGLADEALGKRGAAGYGRLPFGPRLRMAGQILAAARKVGPAQLGPALDRVFARKTYDPNSELDLQNVTTPRSYLPLVARTLPGDDLSAGSRALLRKILSTGCCRPERPRLKASAWWAKGGITWRVLNLTGVVELPDGSRLAYVYMNDLSQTADAGALRANAPAAVTWIESQLLALLNP
ncbi:serine hydrolase [Deinococcus altitudinis]|uniref:serine hydrolase n=1 Tax=Deinococcus altitudinis TaxID=468914 RepID=UPI0038913F79